MLSANWKPRRAGGVTQFKFKGLQTRKAGGVIPSLGVEEDEVTCPNLCQ
jgi:hypothetical protein